MRGVSSSFDYNFTGAPTAVSLNITRLNYGKLCLAVSNALSWVALSNMSGSNTQYFLALLSSHIGPRM